MKLWQRAAQCKGAYAHLVAGGITLLFSLPVALYLGYQQYRQSDEMLAQAEHHAARHLQQIDETLARAAVAARLMADALPGRGNEEMRGIGADLLKLVAAAARIEVARSGYPALTVESGPQPAGKRPLAAARVAGGELHPLGDPVITVRGERVVVSQPLTMAEADAEPSFWGYTAVTLPFANLVAAAGIDELSQEGYRVRLQHAHDSMTPGTVLFESPGEAMGIGAVQTLPLPGSGSLRLELQPLTVGIGALPTVTWVCFALGCLVLYILNLRLLHRPAELEREVAYRTRLLDEEKMALQQEIASRIHAEGLLEKSHRLLDTIFEHIPGMIVLKRASDLRIARVNRSCEQLLGRSRSSLIGRCNEEIYPGELADRLSQFDRQAMADNRLVELPVERIAMPGQPERWIHFRKVALGDGSGHPEYILEFGEDMTEREKLDQRLREHLNFLEQLIDAIPGPLFVKDTRGRYIGVNKAFESFIGIDRDRIAGKTAFDFTPPPLAHDDLRADTELIAAAGSQIYESTVRDAAGRDRHVMFHKAVFHNTAGELGGIVGIMLDITERKAAEEKLQLSARVFENSTEGITITDAANRILMVNKAFSDVTGYAPEEVIGKNPSILKSGRQSPEFYAELWQTLQTRGAWRGEIENRRKNGEIYPEWLDLSVVRNAEGNVTNYVAVFSDLTRRKEIENRLDFLAHYDSLTSLPNRSLFHHHLGQSLAKARSKRSLLAVLVMDIDRFKLINDTVGHGAGDRLLLEIANRLTASVAPNDCVCRLGGDEFALIVHDSQTPAEVASRTREIQQALRRTIVLNGHEIHLAASIGISLYPDDADDGETLMLNADSAMYSAIADGGNTFRFFQQEMNSRSAERMRLEGRLHHALERGELAVHFQPLVCARSGRIVGAEALLRWYNKEEGCFIPPATFVPLLEETGLIVPVGEWVMRTACRENGRWAEITGHELFVAVNLSALQLADERLPGKVRAILEESGIAPGRLEIELTESAVMRDAERGIRTMHELKDLGVSLSIDDFGTGYSSLSYLKQLPLDTLKIDRSFVIDAPHDPEAVSIIHAIVAMGHSLQFEIIAEGVENTDQVAFLRQAAVDILQGFHFSRPCPADSFLALLQAAPSYPPETADTRQPLARPIPLRPQARRPAG